jgi:FKBP-type peptidyl-prolyl cis-trans isomerase SlyD
MSAQDLTIEKGRIVGLYFTLKDEAGQELDTNRRGGKPLAYLCGAGNVVPGIEEALLGKKKGDFVAVAVPPEKGFGVRRPELVEQIRRTSLPANVPLRLGVRLRGSDSQGRAMEATVVAIEGEMVTLDKNHPLAGRTLNYELTVVGVREAREEEHKHGHAHGPGGAHH